MTKNSITSCDSQQLCTDYDLIPPRRRRRPLQQTRWPADLVFRISKTNDIFNGYLGCELHLNQGRSALLLCELLSLKVIHIYWLTSKRGHLKGGKPRKYLKTVRQEPSMQYKQDVTKSKDWIRDSYPLVLKNVKTVAAVSLPRNRLSMLVDPILNLIGKSMQLRKNLILHLIVTVSVASSTGSGRRSPIAEATLFLKSRSHQTLFTTPVVPSLLQQVFQIERSS